MIAREAIFLISAIKSLGYKPNDFERKFILSIIKLAEREQVKPLSYKQSEVMNAIYRKAAGGGNYQARQRI